MYGLKKTHRHLSFWCFHLSRDFFINSHTHMVMWKKKFFFLCSPFSFFCSIIFKWQRRLREDDGSLRNFIQVNYENGFQICTVVGSFKCRREKTRWWKVSVMRSTFQKVRSQWALQLLIMGSFGFCVGLFSRREEFFSQHIPHMRSSLHNWRIEMFVPKIKFLEIGIYWAPILGTWAVLN